MLVGGAVACTSSPPSREAREAPALTATARVQATPNGNAPPGVPRGAWIDALRMERWAEAARLLDQASAGRQPSPALRYARARIAQKLGDYQRARQLLESLELTLPELRADIARNRAAAELEVGPFESAARYYAAGSDPESWLRAGLAFERGKNFASARQAADRALALLAQSAKKNTPGEPRKLEVNIHGLRARTLEALADSKAALVELRWLAKNAPGSSEAANIDERLQRISKAAALTRQERLARATSLANRGLVEATDRELELAETSPGTPLAQADVLRARGFARYMARQDYALASELLAKAAESGGENAAKDSFYAARSLSRAQEDERAIVSYRNLAARFPRSSFAEDAQFLIGRLKYIGGSWSEASAAYTRYLARYGKRGRYGESARYERSVAWLAGGNAKAAAASFAELAQDESSARVRARLLALEGTARVQAGDTRRGVVLLQAVIREQPLSFAALTSAKRLQALKQPVPPVLGPMVTGRALPALDPALPRSAEFFNELGLDRDAERELSLHQNSLFRTHAPRGNEALCVAYGRLACATERYRVGQRAASEDALNVAPSNASRWLWECVYPRPYAPLVSELSTKESLPADLLYAVMRQESGFRPEVVSPAGAVGLMQIIEPTAKQLARELALEFSPESLASPPYNLTLAARYLHKLLEAFHGNVALTAAAYNAGPAAVSRWLESGEGLPLDLFVARIPYDETRNYVERVVSNVARYAYLAGGEAALPELELELELGLRAPPSLY